VFIKAYEKRGEGINAYLVYKIETLVNNIPGYTKSKSEVWRRFSDFLGLRDKLAERYQVLCYLNSVIRMLAEGNCRTNGS
jgi:hypothetical protein